MPYKDIYNLDKDGSSFFIDQLDEPINDDPFRIGVGNDGTGGFHAVHATKDELRNLRDALNKLDL